MPDSVNFLFIHDLIDLFSDFNGSADLFSNFFISFHELQFLPFDFFHVDISRLFSLNFFLNSINILFLLMNGFIELIRSVGHLPQFIMLFEIVIFFAELIESFDVVTVFRKGFQVLLKVVGHLLTFVKLKVTIFSVEEITL